MEKEVEKERVEHGTDDAKPCRLSKHARKAREDEALEASDLLSI
jgi:hypothetical protein